MMNEEPSIEPTQKPSYAPADDEPARMSEGARAANIFLSPGETFEDINRKPTWIVPILVTIVFTLGFGYLMHSKILTEDVIERMTRERIEQALERRGAAPLPPEALEQQISLVKKINQFWHVSALIGLFIVVLITASVYFLILLLLQAEAKFKKVFSVVSWSWMPQAVAASIVGVVTLLMRDPETIDPTNPLATNLAAMLPAKDTAPSLLTLASSADVFSLWFLILLSIGFSKISRRVSVGKAAVAVFVVWGLYVLAKAGLAAFQGGG
jgi:hypothetical protein